MTQEATAPQFTDTQATDEAVLLLTRKLMRLHRDAYADVWAKLPDGAKRAILAAEARADVLRDSGPRTWAPDLDDE